MLKTAKKHISVFVEDIKAELDLCSLGASSIHEMTMMMPELRPSDIALATGKDIQECRRDSWLVTGKLFTIHIHQAYASERAAQQRLDELCSAANDIAMGGESFRDMGFLPFILDNDDAPRAILGFARMHGDPDIRVTLFPPFTGLQIRSGNG